MPRRARITLLGVENGVKERRKTTPTKRRVPISPSLEVATYVKVLI
jgi:hypothetical protein